MSGNLRPRERVSIGALVKLLRVTAYPEIQAPEWIDGALKGDGLPEARASPYLIEHFTIDSTPDQRKLGAQFIKLIDGLEQEFATIPFSLSVAMSEDIAQTGRNWKRQRHALAAWISNVAPTLSDGHHPDVRVAGFDTDFHVWKNRAPSRTGVKFKRWTPSNDSGLVERLRKDVSRKASKLAAHKRDDERTLLLLESDDVALMSGHAFLTALRIAFPAGICDVDEIWFCHTVTKRQSDFLNVATGDYYLFDRINGTVEGKTWITHK